MTRKTDDESRDDASNTIAFRVTRDEAGRRVDKLVAEHGKSGGRRKVAELFERGAVRVGGHVVKKGAVAREGDSVSVHLSDAIRPEPDAPLVVRLETRDVVVVDKPASQPTAPARDGDVGTLAGALLGRYPEMASVGYRAREPGLLHRLDTETSGLVIAARSPEAFASLRAALSEGRIGKRYLAVVRAADLPESGVVETPLEPDPDDGRRVAVPAGFVRGALGAPRDARAAPRAPQKTKADEAPRTRITRFRTVHVAHDWALVEVEAPRAYRHQVRVHLAFIGHPIAGDALYGGPKAPLAGQRHALHASYVAWTGDDVVPAFAVESPLPDDLAALVFPR
ncbi:MAG TPA: RluA family pseudouridine synthase [Polyangiaceae bacterium]|nr:RluA family pseudouridine synthase [Polyangiaceae bacterium]